MKPEQEASNQTSILFGGVPSIPSPEIFENARKHQPEWYKVLHAAYEQFATRPENVGVYADPKGKGATVEQVWLVFSLLGVEPYCLLAYPLPEESVKKITRLVKYTAREIVEALKSVQRSMGEVNASTLHYDGHTGHCIRITAYDAAHDRFIYHDPWPLKSLLCAENNMAGVEAQPEGTRWSVTATELERVVFASFVFPHMWATVQGIPFDLMFDVWRESSFAKHFHFRQTAEGAEGGVTRRTFSAGPFKTDVTLVLDSRDSGKIVRAVLLLNKEWMKKNMLLALDVGKSFIAALAPEPDKGRYVGISETLWSMRDPNVAMAFRDRSPEESDEVGVVHAFMGSVGEASVRTDFATLSLKNLSHDQALVQKVAFTLL